MTLRGLLKPTYLFSPRTLVARISAIFHPASGVQLKRMPWGADLEVDLGESVGREIFTHGILDIAVSECCWRLLDEGDMAVDIGANIGHMTSLFSSKVGKSGLVHAFEPHPVIRARLERNVARLATVQNVRVHDCAIGATSSSGHLLEPEGFRANQGTAFVSTAGQTAGDTGNGYPIEVRTLDDFFPAETIKLLKIDAEGFELPVLQGAGKLLSQKRIAHVIYEDHSFGGSGLPTELRGLGYEIFSIGRTLTGLRLRSAEQKAAVDTSWEAPSFLATIDPAFVQKKMGSGWHILRAKRDAS
jgi:FkbM family methyltransferase